MNWLGMRKEGQPSSRGCAERERERGPEAAPEDRGTKRKAEEQAQPSRWIGLHGLTETEAKELETDSFLADLGELDAMATLPLPTAPEADMEDVHTVPWLAPQPGGLNQPSLPTSPRREGEGYDPDPSPRSHRRRPAQRHV